MGVNRSMIQSRNLTNEALEPAKSRVHVALRLILFAYINMNKSFENLLKHHTPKRILNENLDFITKAMIGGLQI